MAITIDLPPQMVREAEGYVISRGTTIEQLLFDHLKDDLAKHRAGEDVYAYLMSQSGWLPKDYTFSRDEANAR